MRGGRGPGAAIAVLWAAAVLSQPAMEGGGADGRPMHPPDEAVYLVLQCKRVVCAEGYPDKIPPRSDIVLRWSLGGLQPGASYRAVFELFDLGILVWHVTSALSITDADGFHVQLPVLNAGLYTWELSVHGAMLVARDDRSDNIQPNLLARVSNTFTIVNSIDHVVSVLPAKSRDEAGGVAPAASLPESSACQVQTLRLCQGTCRAHERHGADCIQTQAVPPESCSGTNTSATSPLFAMYVLNVPGEDERWQRMLRALEDSFLPGPLLHRFDTVPLDDYRVVEYPEDLFEHISWVQRYSNLLSHVEAWQHFSTDPDADDNAWALFFEDDIVVHPEVRGDRRRVGGILDDGFALGAAEGFVYLGLCGMKTAEQVRREWKDRPLPPPPEGYGTGSLPDGWLEITGPHGPLYLHRETNTYTVHPPLSPGVRSGGVDATCKRAGHGVEHIKGCGTCLHAYGVAKWRAKTLWRQLESLPDHESLHPIMFPPDSLTLDVYLFQAMVEGLLPMVWNLGANLTDPSCSQNKGLAFQDSYLPGGILY